MPMQSPYPSYALRKPRGSGTSVYVAMVAESWPFSLPKPRHELKLSQHRSLLRLMTMHAAEDIVENVNRLRELQVLVEHDALGAVRHGGIGNLRSEGWPSLARLSSTASPR